MNDDNQQSQYPPPPQPYYGERQWPPMKVGEWLITRLLLIIPIANIVLTLIWAFGSDVNPSKKTYFQAELIIWAISIVLSVILSVLFAATLMALASNFFAIFS